jgi:lysophospholipase L1-like esterase
MRADWKATSRRLLAAGAIVTMGAAAAPEAGARPRDAAPCRWVATWGVPPMGVGPNGEPARSFENQTVRQVVHASVGGQRVRVRISNAFGGAPLRLGAVHLARHAGGASIVPGSDRALTWSGRSSITVPAGAVAVSDPVDLAVPARADLAVSIYVPDHTGPATYHDAASHTTYISGAGDFTGAAELPVAETAEARFWLTVVEVLPRERANVLVAIGDSITKGARSTLNANRSWPDLLSARLNRNGRSRLGVVNQGIGCGRLLRDLCGPGGANRLDRDVLAVTGATHVVSALGLVDIILPTAFGIPEQTVSADEIIVGLRQVIERAHAQDLVIYGATLTPVGASVFPGVFTPENEAKRQAVNHWIRTSGAFDAVVDFDAVVRDPADPTRLRAAYSSDDGIHPNDAGYEAMADAIDPSLLR